MDLLLLTGTVDNRTFLETLKLKLDGLDVRLSEVEQSRKTTTQDSSSP